MALEDHTVANSNLFLSRQFEQDHSKSSCINKCSCSSIAVALGIVVSLGGVFLLLACYQILPHGINAMTGMGFSGQVIGYGTMGIGLVTIAISVVKRCAYKNGTVSSSQNEVKSSKTKEKDEKSSLNENLEKPSVEEQAREKQRIAVKTILKHYRDYLVRKRVKEIEKREAATLTIQSFIRMHTAKKLCEQKKRQVLNYSLFEGAKSYTDDSVKLTGVPNAPQGASKHKIYMPKDLPVVIRVCKDENDSSRFPKMKQALAICFKNQFRCVEVPRARLQGSFIVEERLPSENASAIKGMAFYYENREHYTDAVKEFTAFLCYGYLSDIVGGNKDRLSYLGFSGVPRFDNLLLYFHKGEKLYKIGVVDVETFILNSSKPTRNNVYHALSSCVQLFPYHFDAIIEVGKTFCDVPPEAMEALCAESLKSMQLYKIVCEGNFSFYKKHNITLQNQIVVSLTSERREELKKHMGAFLRNIHENGLKDYLGIRDCLNGNPDESVLGFQEKLFPKMIFLVEEEFKEIFSSCSISTMLTNYGELIERRMIEGGITSGLQNQFLSNEKKSDAYALLQTVFKSKFAPTFAIFEEILNQLVKGGELSYYKAHVYGSEDLIFF